MQIHVFTEKNKKKQCVFVLRKQKKKQKNKKKHGKANYIDITVSQYVFDLFYSYYF